MFQLDKRRYWRMLVALLVLMTNLLLVSYGQESKYQSTPPAATPAPEPKSTKSERYYMMDGNNGTGEYIQNLHYGGFPNYGISFFTNFTRRLTLTDQGLGIGTPLPNYKLDIYSDSYTNASGGVINLFGPEYTDHSTGYNLPANGGIRVGLSTTSGFIQAYKKLNTGDGSSQGTLIRPRPLVLNAEGGDVGIGKEPKYTLDVAGQINATGFLVGGKPLGAALWTQNGKNISFMNGNVGINTVSTAYLLDVNGSVNAKQLYLNGTSIETLIDSRVRHRHSDGAESESTDWDNTVLGSEAGVALTSGSRNTVLGALAGTKIATGNDNVTIGYRAGSNLDVASDNVIIGTDAALTATKQEGNVVIGRGAGYNEAANFNHSVFIGYMAGATFQNTDIDKNIAEQTVTNKSIFIVNNQAHTEHPLLFGYFGENERPEDPESEFVPGTMGQLGINTHELIDSCALTVKGAVHIGPFDRDPNYFDYDEMVKDYLLWVERGVVSEDFIIRNVEAWREWPDYVFNQDYERQDLISLKAYIDEHKHLPGVTSRLDVKKTKGYDLRMLDMQLLQKIEELTLYTIEQQQQLDQQATLLNQLREELQEVRAQLKKP